MNDVVKIYEAKTNLSKLVKKAQAGETIYIGAYGQPQAVISPVPVKKPIKIGIWKDKKIGYKDEDIVGPDPDITKLFEDSKVMPDGSF
ncbi:MAG: type II toxin-antitoxin system prevent-host-death family antitoxin [Candidatus Levybacteria bacterium]|nr:type II toxin-antitoxin system prevent-host-death family antitoxin [Candidatus Saccharibacteria bacterium]MBI2420525.1 type II toxin-antitoxin system prevent-host-death family antitoxin [Candidatus Levybacteria bacterium]